MAQPLQGKTVAILVADGFEQVELTEPRKALQQAGAEARVVSPAKEKVKGWNHTEWGDEIPVDVPLDRANAEQYDALLLPGGVMNRTSSGGIPRRSRSSKRSSTRGSRWL